jgi:hypothetical protein
VSNASTVLPVFSQTKKEASERAACKGFNWIKAEEYHPMKHGIGKSSREMEAARFARKLEASQNESNGLIEY